MICTIHQPSSQLYHLFDDVLLLAQGGTQLFFGKAGEARPWWEEKGERCPDGWNPADCACGYPLSRARRRLMHTARLCSPPRPRDFAACRVPPSPPFADDLQVCRIDHRLPAPGDPRAAIRVTARRSAAPALPDSSLLVAQHERAPDRGQEADYDGYDAGRGVGQKGCEEFGQGQGARRPSLFLGRQDVGLQRCG